MTNEPGNGGVDFKRIFFIFLGIGIFVAVYFWPTWPDAIDPNGRVFVLGSRGQLAMALFGLAATWWVTEVVPIGVTSIMIGIIQALFFIRPGVLPVAQDELNATLDLTTTLAADADPADEEWVQIALGADALRDGWNEISKFEPFASSEPAAALAADPTMARLQIRMNASDWQRNAGLFEGTATEVARRSGGQVTVVGDHWDAMADKKPIKGAWRSFTDFLAPSVWFIFGSLSFGMVFTKTGLTRRLAYKMLSLVGEKTSMIYLGCFVLTSALTLIMAHTAVAATIYPLLVAIYGLYTTDDKPTKFGKGLFMGMAFVAGAGSIITLLGAARGAVALGFYREVTGLDVGFFELAYFMAPVGVLMTLLLWGFFMVWYKPEKATIPGLRERSKTLYKELGPLRRNELLALVIVGSVIAILGARALMPGDSMIKDIDKAGIILLATVLFFLFRILKLEDLEGTSWNIILLFGGAMSIGYCLWQTGAAEWLAIHWLSMFKTAPGWVFVVAIAFFVLVMTNLIMNVAAIAISMPVALVIAPYLDVAPQVVMFASLVTAGMPFLLLVGAAPNAIAYASRQFTSREFFVTGIPASILLMVVVTVFVLLIWPIMGMPVSLGG
jgi:solute carrier family 13 (sodium-dependent dicarboxylate transporter), member 2/3/5